MKNFFRNLYTSLNLSILRSPIKYLITWLIFSLIFWFFLWQLGTIASALTERIILHDILRAKHFIMHNHHGGYSRTTINNTDNNTDNNNSTQAY
ncbi:MAG: hypothetical protein LBD46_07865 [Endomicrobium sp.]|nr:hypothetical protein [Endomicrobium sp.]